MCVQEDENRGWRRVVTSSTRHEFTLRHLLKRKLGTSKDSIRESLIGDSSFASCIMKYFSADEKLKFVRCVPSASRPSPGKLGYYNGGYIVRNHAKMNRVGKKKGVRKEDLDLTFTFGRLPPD